MKKTLKRVFCLALAVIMTFSLAACGGNGKDDATYTYNLYMSASPTNWNPHTWEMSSDSEIMSYIEMGLVDVTIAADGSSYEWVMEMAESISDITSTYADKDKWGIGADETGRVWEIKLNKNAKWANGEVINADTYVYSMQQLLNPEMKNYRAGNYTSGDSAIVGASGYFNNDKVGQPFFSEISDADGNLAVTYDQWVKGADGVYTTADGKAIKFVLDSSLVWLGGYSITDYKSYFGTCYDTLAALADDEGFVPVTDDTIAALTEFITSDDWGNEPVENLPYYAYYETGTYEETPWEKVGLVKVDDYTILYITELPIEEFYMYTALSSNWIVYKDLYEAGKSKTGDLVATNYGTSVDTYMSYGPYKLTSFEVDKQFICEKNENWYGYTDGEHKGQYQTTCVKYQIVADHSTQLQLFNQGAIDEIALESDDMATYKMSDNLLKTDQTYTFRWIFATDINALSALETEANDGANKKVLSYDDFRKALSLAMDRDKFTTEATSGYKPAYYLINSLYYYNVAEDPGSVYRNTDVAKAAVLNLYGIDFTSDNIDEKYASVTGYDVEEAKKLFQSVYEQAKADGNYTDGQAIKIRCCASAASSLTAEDIAQQDLLNQFVTAATVGTGFEGKITIEFFSGLSNRYASCAAGEVEMIRGAWGGAAFYPFNLLRCYTDAEYAGTIHESCGWDPTTATVDITYDFNGDGTAETLTDTYYNWSMSIAPGGTYTDMDTKLNILAAVETAILGEYQCIPWAAETVCSLYSQKIAYATTNYNIMYAYGGVRLMTYNYSDAEWDAYVKEQGGTLNYE